MEAATILLFILGLPLWTESKWDHFRFFGSYQREVRLVYCPVSTTLDGFSKWVAYEDSRESMSSVASVPFPLRDVIDKVIIRSNAATYHEVVVRRLLKTVGFCAPVVRFEDALVRLTLETSIVHLPVRTGQTSSTKSINLSRVHVHQLLGRPAILRQLVALKQGERPVAGSAEDTSGRFL